ncbi:hypothetical protein MMC14_009376 [Varicellaria rhodocarpa]|nr:hypothetical protein [Varicellaria rhodocarpa]
MGDPKTPLGSALPHVLLIVVQLLALSLPPFKYRALVFVPVIVGLACVAYQNMFSEDVELLASLMGQWSWYLGTIEKLTFTHPEEDFWRLDRARAEATSMSPGPSKLRWSAALWGGIRGVGWNHQVRGVPKATAPQTKWRFILHRLVAYAKYYLISDILVIYTSRHYYSSPDVDLASLTIRDPSWLRSLINASVAGALVQFPIQLHYTLGSIIAVFLGLSQPKMGYFKSSTDCDEYGFG